MNSLTWISDQRRRQHGSDRICIAKIFRPSCRKKRRETKIHNLRYPHSLLRLHFFVYILGFDKLVLLQTGKKYLNGTSKLFPICDVHSARRQLPVIFGTSGRRVAPDRNLMFILRTLEDSDVQRVVVGVGKKAYAAVNDIDISPRM